MSNYSLIEINRTPYELEWNDEMELRLYFKDKTNPQNSNCEKPVLVPFYESEDEINVNPNKEEPINNEIEENNQIVLDNFQLIGKKYLENNEINEVNEEPAKKKEGNKLNNNEVTNASLDKKEKNREQSNEKNKFKYIRFNQTILKDIEFLKSEKELNEFISEEKINLQTKIFPKPEKDTNYNLIKTNSDNYLNQNKNNLDYFSITRETEFDNNFREVVENIHIVIGGNEFKLFSESRENYGIKFKQKPIFKVLVLGKKRKRKSMDDLIRKKLKVRFCSEIISILNSLLKKLKIKKKFGLPQSMKTNVTKTQNKIWLNMTLRAILEEGYFDNENENDDDCFVINKKIFKILQKKGGDNVIESILNEKVKNIYDEYLISEEFQNSIKNLEKQCNSYEYIHNYIKVAKNFVEFFTAKKSKGNN